MTIKEKRKTKKLMKTFYMIFKILINASIFLSMLWVLALTMVNKGIVTGVISDMVKNYGIDVFLCGLVFGGLAIIAFFLGSMEEKMLLFSSLSVIRKKQEIYMRMLIERCEIGDFDGAMFIYNHCMNKHGDGSLFAYGFLLSEMKKSTSEYTKIADELIEEIKSWGK